MCKSQNRVLTCGVVVSLVMIGLAAAVNRAMAMPYQSLPRGRQMIPELSKYSFFGKQNELGKMQVVDVQGENFKKALRIETSPGAGEEYGISVVAPVIGPVKKGDVLLGHFFLRCDESMTGEGYTTFTFEVNHPEFEKSAQFKISARKDWKEVFVPFVAARDYPAGSARISFWVGYDRQAIELGGIEVINYESKLKRDDLPETKITYEGREANALWRKDALDRIEQIRKGDLQVYVTDASGAAVPDASVHTVLKRNAFGFGTCVDADLLVSNSPDAVEYKQTILSLFNRAVFENEMKWQATWDGVSPDVDRAMQWLTEHHIPVRGHNLVWPGWRWLPQQLREYENDPAKLREITAKHITYMVSHFRGQLPEWDVVNEPYTNNNLIELLGGRQIMVQWYNLAHQADPNCRLFLNDFGILDGGTHNPHREAFYGTIQYLLAQKAPLGGIGIQSHFGSELPAPVDVVKIYDRFSGFGLPIESTELSLALHDDDVQADYLRDYMIAAFSVPKVQAIMLWGFWQQRHWRADGGIFRDDWSMRPAAKVWADLTQHQWSTDATMKTDANGQGNVRGFLGSYEVSVTTAGGKTKTVPEVELLAGGSRVNVQVE